MKDIVIIGAGGVGRETAWIIEQINMKKPTWNIIGFVDDNKEIWNGEINGYKVLGNLSCLNDLENKFEFATIIHPDAYLNRTIEIGRGSIVYPGVIMTTNISIGNHVIVSPKCGIGHDSVIKDYVSLLWNVNISGFDVIEEGVLIGSGATIIQ